MRSKFHIPKIIHQTWKTEHLPETFKPLVASWKRFHPDWEYVLWTDRDCRSFVADHYPDFLDHYDSYSFAIQRVDAFRYLLLHKMGGVYADLDTESLCPIDPLLAGATFVAAPEPKAHLKYFGGSPLLGNAVFASKPEHGFLQAVLARLKETSAYALTTIDVLRSTGPIQFHSVLRDYPNSDVTLLPSSAFYQPEKVLSKKRNAPGFSAEKERLRQNGAYTIHYWNNSWVSNLAGELINETPNAIKGFTFFPQIDSPGNDLANYGRNIKEVAKDCLEDHRIVGFNTDGYVKESILPRYRWRTMKTAGLNEGLYIKNKLLRPYLLAACLGIRPKARSFAA